MDAIQQKLIDPAALTPLLQIGAADGGAVRGASSDRAVRTVIPVQEPDALVLGNHELPAKPEELAALVLRISRQLTNMAAQPQSPPADSTFSSLVLDPALPAQVPLNLSKAISPGQETPLQTFWQSLLGTAIQAGLEASAHSASPGAAGQSSELLMQAASNLESGKVLFSTFAEPHAALEAVASVPNAPFTNAESSRPAKAFIETNPPLASSPVRNPPAALGNPPTAATNPPYGKTAEAVPSLGVRLLPAEAGLEVHESAAPPGILNANAPIDSRDPGKVMSDRWTSFAGGGTVEPAAIARNKDAAPSSGQHISANAGIGAQPARASEAKVFSQHTSNANGSGMPDAADRAGQAKKTGHEASDPLPNLQSIKSSDSATVSASAVPVRQWSGLVPVAMQGRIAPAWLAMQWSPVNQTSERAGGGGRQGSAHRMVSLSLNIVTEALGPMTFHLAWLPGETVGTFVAANAQVAEWARAGLHGLERQLESLGMPETRFRIAVLQTSTFEVG